MSRVAAGADTAPRAASSGQRKSTAPRSKAMDGVSQKPAATAATATGAEGDRVRRSARGAGLRSRVSPEQRHAMIAEGAYLRAERRGFSGGDPLSDWLAAEEEVDELLGANVTNSAQ